MLRALGVTIRHGDIRLASDFETLPAVDVVVDAAANPSVLAGVDGRDLKPAARRAQPDRHGQRPRILPAAPSALVILSTSRVYSIPPLAALQVRVTNDAFEPDPVASMPPGLTALGVDGVVLHRATGVAVRRDQAGGGATGARIRRDLSIFPSG